MFKKIKNMFRKELNSSAAPAPETDVLRINELLHGTRVGQMQSVGVMQVIPLLSDLEDDRFISPMDANISTKGYGDLVFNNPTDKTLLVPCHTGFIVKEAAQDHAMSHTGIVPAKKTLNFNTAMCIQATQGGCISNGQHKMMILPHALREQALNLREKQEYNKLWSAIREFNMELGLQSVGNLVVFLDGFQQQLDHFVAEFECLPQQVGAIVLINGEVVGVERAPSHAYWLSIWEALIRECYGSKAIQASRKLKEGTPVQQTRVPLRSDGIHSLDDLAQALDEVREQEEELARTRVRELLDVPFERKRESKHKDLHIETIQNGRFLGQVILDDARVCYASVIVGKDYTRQQDWSQAEAFTL